MPCRLISAWLTTGGITELLIKDDLPDVESDISPYRRVDETVDFERYAAIIRRLRGPDGCPWDRKQTLQTLRRFIVEESFELVSSIHDSDPAHIAEELGDVLLVTLLMADALEAENGITLSDILRENADKLIRRHPHVFAKESVSTSDEVVVKWNAIKKDQEGRSESPTTVTAGLPPLERAQEIQKKAGRLGFDWETVGPAIMKVREELEELEALIEQFGLINDPGKAKNNADVEKEIGDLLFSAVNVSRHLNSDASIALDRSNEAFLRRFAFIEKSLHAQGKDIAVTPLEELDSLWEAAKKQLRRKGVS